MFKVGEKVRIVEERPHDFSNGPGFIGDMLETCGKTGEIIHYQNSKYIRVRFDNDSSWSYMASWLRKMRPNYFKDDE